jgi:hypothetical protein
VATLNFRHDHEFSIIFYSNSKKFGIYVKEKQKESQIEVSKKELMQIKELIESFLEEDWTYKSN